MSKLLQGQNFETATLITASATRDAVFSELKRMADLSKPGDLCVYTNSSHGGTLPDYNFDEADGIDETVCLYDGEMVDDELYQHLTLFKPGVRVLVISDSCHSGTVTRLSGQTTSELPPNAKAMPRDIALSTFEENRAMYEPILAAKATKARDVKANVLLLGGCQDNQLSFDGPWGGLFTRALTSVWNNGAWRGCYPAFHKAIGRRLPPEQSPSLYWVNRSAAFENSKPFSV